jgi:thiol-disulfide isomerase/thioredoxin
LLLVESKELDLVQIYREKEENAQISSPVRPDGKKWEEHRTDEMLELEKNPNLHSTLPWFQAIISKEDGTFYFEDIPAGKYYLSFQDAETQPKIEVVLPKGKTFTEEAQDLGTIDLRDDIKKTMEKRAAEEAAKKKLKEIAAGDILPDFSFLDMDGKERRFSEYKGKTVLIYFWAAKANYTRSALPTIQAIAEQHKANENFVVLRMSRDYDPDLTKGFIQEVGVPGWHGFLTKESFSTWNAYRDSFQANRAWLISPEGKVLAGDLLLRKMKAAVDAHLSAP